MKISSKITMILVTAMVMTIAMVVLVYAEVIYPQAWNEATGRYTQVYEMNTGTNWRYTTSITQYGLPSEDGYGVDKMFPSRDCLVQCISNGLTAFPTYYQVYTLDRFPLTTENNFIGTGTYTLDFPYASNAENKMCLGIRNDPRYSTTVTNKGNWSPDTY